MQSVLHELRARCRPRLRLAQRGERGGWRYGWCVRVSAARLLSAIAAAPVTTTAAAAAAVAATSKSTATEPAISARPTAGSSTLSATSDAADVPGGPRAPA